MDIQVLTGYFQEYGITALFIIVFLEYLNLPGFPAGIILPLAGIFVRKGNIDFLQAFLLSVLAGLSGSLLLYFLGRFGGNIFLKEYLKKFPKHKAVIEKTIRYINEKGCFGIFLAKLIPMIRTLISIPAGVLKFKLMNFDLIHVHHPVISGYMGCYLGEKYNIPVVFTHHTRYEQYLHHFKIFQSQYISEQDCNSETIYRKRERVKAAAEKFVIYHNKVFTNHCDLVLAPTPGIKDFLRENGTIKEIQVLPTGLAAKDYTFCESEVQKIKKKYGERGKRLFCTVSRLEQEKNINFLLEAMKIYKDRNGGDFRLLIIGEGSQKSNLMRKTMELGIKDQVVFTGCVPNDKITAYYNACELFLFASTTETQGIVLLEAMAAGLPVIAVGGSGVKDVVLQGRNGYLTKEDIYE